MAKILAYTTPAMGHFFPISVLLTELRNRGHDIALRTLAAGVDAGRGMGFATAPVDPRIEAMPWMTRAPRTRSRRCHECETHSRGVPSMKSPI